MKVVLSFLLATALGLAGCKRDDVLVPDHALAWLHQDTGTLYFRNPATGDTARMHTQRTTEIRHVSTSKGNFTEYNAQLITLTCKGPFTKGDPGEPQVRFIFHGDGFDVYPPGAIAEGQGYAAYVETASNSHDERFTNQGAELVEFLDNTQLAGRTYRRLLHIRLKAITLPPNTWENTVRELWYSKDDGLVELTTTTGRHWQRR